MKDRHLPEGYTVLPSGAIVRIAHGRELTVFFGPAPSPTPSRTRVQKELFDLTGVRVWLENWPDDSRLHHGVDWPGLRFEAVILDHDERIAKSRDIATIGVLLTELVELGLHDELGWSELRIDPAHLPTFGGERPDVPPSFFWRWDSELRDTGLPAIPLSWDAHQVLIAADPHHGPFCVPRHPSRLFSGTLAERCGLHECSDAEAFDRIASVLPWDGTMETLGASGLYFLTAHTRSGTPYGAGDPHDLGIVVRETTDAVVQRVRVVIAAGRTQALRENVLEIISSHSK
jgi:hypothetical protein